MKQARYVFLFLCAMIFYMTIGDLKVYALDTPPAGEATTEQKPIVVPTEPAGSDLTMLQYGTKLRFHRWIQSFTKDSQYYYFIQVTDPVRGHLRLTRVRYQGLGSYTSEHMDLMFFGHGTNLDLAVYGGRTYLWTGSDAKPGTDISTSISCFQFVPNAVVWRHSSVSYKIRKGNKGKAMTNVYPAVSENGKLLCVRFTTGSKQYFQYYSLSKGYKINPKKVKKQVVLKPTLGEFQGFDIRKTELYTIEGAPSAAFLAGYDPKRIAYPTVIRAYDYKKKAAGKKLITGAAGLKFREPEGIEVSGDGRMQIMFVDGTLTDQNCNIYHVNSKMTFSKKTKYR